VAIKLKPHHPMNIEPLESRIAPSVAFTFTEADGDTVTVTSSKGAASDLMNAAHITDGQLTLLDLTSAIYKGAVINVAVTRIQHPSGDGFVNVGYINATGNDLASVTVRGDLGRIDAGDATFSTSGLATQARAAVPSALHHSAGSCSAPPPGSNRSATG